MTASRTHTECRIQRSPSELAGSRGLSTGNRRAERADRLTRRANTIQLRATPRHRRTFVWRGYLRFNPDELPPDTPFFEAVEAVYRLPR